MKYVYTYIYVYIYMYIHTFMYTYIYIHTRVYIYIMYAHFFQYITRVSITFIHITCIHIFWTCIYTCKICMYIHTFVYIYINIYTLIYILCIPMTATAPCVAASTKSDEILNMVRSRKMRSRLWRCSNVLQCVRCVAVSELQCNSLCRNVLQWDLEHGALAQDALAPVMVALECV